MEKTQQLTFSKIMWSMVIILAVWAAVWYPFYIFKIFPDNPSAASDQVLSCLREIIRMIPAMIFIGLYGKNINLRFKELFSFKFNYKMFFIFLGVFLLYNSVASFYLHGKIYFNPKHTGIYDVVLWLLLGLCQELVFRGWNFFALDSVTSKKNAVILSSAFFAVSHWFAYFWNLNFDILKILNVTVFTFAFGVAMCFILIKSKSKSIIPLVILHALWDFLATAIQ